MMRQLRQFRTSVVGLFLLAVFSVPGLTAPPLVQHPNLLLNRAEIDQMRERIHQYEWAAKLFERMKENANGDNIRDQALCYVITQDKSYADRVRANLVGQAGYWTGQFEKVDLVQSPEFGSWNSWGMCAWAYDLTYDTFSAEERQTVEKFLRVVAKTLIKSCTLWTTTSNLLIDKHVNVAMIGYCLGDAEIIDWALRDPGTPYGPRKGGFYPVMDSMVMDGHFWNESPMYALINVVHQFQAYAEAARHYDGTDLYAYKSPTGASIKNMIDGFIRTAFPIEQTGIGGGSIRYAGYGDGSTDFSQYGQWGEPFLVNHPSGGLTMQGDLEIAYQRFKDPAYAWLLSLDPLRANYGAGHAFIWSFRAVTHGEPLPAKVSPPPAPCGVYPDQGQAILRADETPAYWTNGSIAASVMLGRRVEHGHADQYSLMLHGKGRLLYPDVNIIQYERDSLNWTRNGIGHSTLLVDGQNPEAGPFTTRHEFTPEAKFFAVTGTAFKHVTQTRALLVTKDYVADVFHAADDNGAERMFDWVLHGMGRLYPGNPAAWRPSHQLVPYYWSIQNERGRTTDATWHADWIQRTAGCRLIPPMGKEWFDHEVGVRMTMLGVPDTGVYVGDGGLVHGPPNFRIEGNPEGSVPVLVARRTAPAATFAAVHEPYTGKSAVTDVHRLAETPEAVALAVTGAGFTDCVFIGFDEKPHTLAMPDGQTVTFTGYGYIRFGAHETITRGQVKPAPGKPPAAENLPENAAALHAYTLPEEVHVSAEGNRPASDVELHVRCVGAGGVQGKLRVVAPPALRVEPALIDVAPLNEGEERVLHLSVRSTEAAASELYTVQFVPTNGLSGATFTLPVSVGVVISIDRRVPFNKMTVVRAPGYTLKLGQYLGYPVVILDADGNRRYAEGMLHTPLFTLANTKPGTDNTVYPAHDIWLKESSEFAFTNGPGVHATALCFPARTGYSFFEDRFVLQVIPPSDPYATWELNLTNFLGLKDPVRTTTNNVETTFYPPYQFRQGLRVTTLPRPADYQGNGYRIKTSQEVTFKFDTEN